MARLSVTVEQDDHRSPSADLIVDLYAIHIGDFLVNPLGSRAVEIEVIIFSNPAAIRREATIASGVKITTAGSEPMSASGGASFNQPKYTAHAVAAGAVSERNLAKKPMRKAKRSMYTLFQQAVVT